MTDSEMMSMAHEILVGFGEFCGLKVLSVDGETLTATMPLRPEFLNLHGFAHGGATNTLMDTAAGVLATFANRPARRVVTRSADIHYVRPLGGSQMRAEARVLKHGKTCCLVNVDVFDDQDRLGAVGTFDLVYITLKGEDRLIEKIREIEAEKEGERS